MNFKNTSPFLDQVLNMRIVKVNGRIEYLKNALKIGIVLITIVVLCGCSVVSRQEESNTTLSDEHEALCDSKNTLNKKLCRQTMGQLLKFESDVNTYFKEKFNIDGFKLTGINFPYDGFNHGGFHATFQLESDPYVMITDTFDYRDGKYVIEPTTNEPSEVAGRKMLASALIAAEYLKMLPIKEIEKFIDEQNIKARNNIDIFYEYDSGRYFTSKTLATGFINSQNYLNFESDVLNQVISNTTINNEAVKMLVATSQKEKLERSIKLFPMMQVKDENEAKRVFEQFQENLKKTEYEELFFNRAIWYTDKPAEYKVIVKNSNSGEIVING